MYQFRFVPECPGNSLEGRAEGCQAATTTCVRDGQGPGPLSAVWRRDVTDPAAPGAWTRFGQTCIPQAPDGAGAQPALTIAMIRSAWARTRFARPEPTLQPPGGRTLVNLPTYFAVTWPRSGYRPNQIRTVVLVGQQVRIRPTLAHVVYDFGDGQSRRSRSLGGGYPDGDVRHTYARTGSLRIRITVSYSGQYSVNGGPWQEVGATVAVPGPATTVQVLTASNHLVPGP